LIRTDENHVEAMNKPKETSHPILIVDDEEIVLVALRDTLLREGYSVVSSPHAVHALSVLPEHEFSVVISDQQMPMVSGLEFLNQVSQIQPNATRILITAVLNIGTLIEAINKAGIFRFVVKPWSREELLATVKAAVERFNAVSSQSRALAEALRTNQELREANARLIRENNELRQAHKEAPPSPLNQ
jgi:DNA-binding NtrC family response regulator